MIPGKPGIIHLGWPESPLGVRPGLGCHDSGALDSPSVAASRLPQRGDGILRVMGGQGEEWPERAEPKVP